MKQGWHRAISAALALALVATLAITLLPQPAYADPGWYDANWGYRKQITFTSDSAKIPSTQSYFPALISLSSDSDLAADAQDDGDDILFTSSDGTTQLDHEIEKFDGGTGQLVAWVEVPSLSTGTVIYMYYGNLGAPNQENPTGVWDSNFKQVLHLKEPPNGTPDEIKDSTLNANHGTTEGSMTSANSVEAKIGNGLAFDGSNDLFRVSDSASLDSTNDEGTLELWIKWTNAADGDHQIVMTSSNRFTTGARDGFEWASQGDGDHFFYPWGGDDSNYNIGSNPFTNGQLHYLVVTLKDSTLREVKIYVDTVSMTFTIENVPTYWIQLASIDDWLWGGNPDRPTRYFDGVFDEIRVSDVVRSTGWITTSHNNQNSPSTFYTVGIEQTNQPPTVDAVALYQSDESTLIIASGSMDPQLEYAVKVTVTDSDTLDDVNEVKVAVFYDSAGTDPTAPGAGDTQTCAIITWTKGGVPAWTIDPSAGTTWVLVTANCKVPSDMGQTTGDWWAHFKPGKVATESGAADDWDIYAKATDAAAGSGELYARDYEMNWYGEITVNTASVDWGTVALGSDFSANEQTGISVTYIANGAYNQQVKASNPWGTAPDQVTLNEAGNPGDGEFSLKADATVFYDDFEEHNVGDTPDGWTLDLEWGSGTLSVQQEGSNKVMDYTHTVDGAPHIHAGDTSWTDYTYETRMRIVPSPGSDHHGVLFRFTDMNNTCYCGVSDTAGTIQLWKRIGGTWTQIGGDWSIPPPGDAWHDWKIVVNGTNIKAYWDGSFLGEANLGSGELTSGKIGCFAGYSGQTRYDLFRVRRFATLGDAVLVLTSDYTTFGIGTRTAESGNTENCNTLWLKLGPLGIPDATYSGTIYYRIAQ